MCACPVLGAAMTFMGLMSAPVSRRHQPGASSVPADAASGRYADPVESPDTRRVVRRPRRTAVGTVAGPTYGMFWGLLFGVLFFVPVLGMTVGTGLRVLMDEIEKHDVDPGFQ